MERRIIFNISWVLIIGSCLFSQSLMNRLRVPITINGKIGIGYDNNFLRLSDKEIQNDNVKHYGITSTIDSPVIKPMGKIIYSPVLSDKYKTNIVSSLSYSHFIQAEQKSYLISKISIGVKLKPYSWLKIGMRDIPQYYLRKYRDRDVSPVNYYNCSFSSRKYFGSYSIPLKWQRNTWIRFYTDFTQEYYNSHFTEFDLKKYMLQFDLNYQTKKRHKFKLTAGHGNAKNISYKSNLVSTLFDRSYVFDKIRTTFIYNDRKWKEISKVGISIFLEQRYYELVSDQFTFDNWKYYLDGRTTVWMDWDIINNIGCKTSFQYRWRNADSQLFGDFEWVEDLKSYAKHEFWLEFSYEFLSDILY